MTLKEAFNQWSVAPRNSVLANRSRDAVNKVLLKEYGDTDLELIDETFAREIFLGSDVAQELKTKAASILVYVLQWGGDNGHCRRPSFDYSVASKPEVKPADKPKGRKKPQISQKDTEEKIYTESLTPNPSPTGEGNAAAQDICDTQKDQCESVSSVAKEESVVKPKRIIRKVDDDICQLDVRTLEVVKKWPHAHRIHQELGIGNVRRAIERCGLAGGFYWSYAKDLDTFAKRLAAHKEHNALVHADHCAQMREKKSLTPNPSPTGEGNAAAPIKKATSAKPKASKKTAAASPPEFLDEPSGKAERGGARGGLKKRTDERTDERKKPAAEPAPVLASLDGSKRQSRAQTTPTPPDSGGEAAAQEPRRSAASKALEVFTDDELFAELDRRGWLCVFTRTEIVTIGGKQPAQDKNRKKVTMF